MVADVIDANNLSVTIVMEANNARLFVPSLDQVRANFISTSQSVKSEENSITYED